MTYTAQTYRFSTDTYAPFEFTISRNEEGEIQLQKQSKTISGEGLYATVHGPEDSDIATLHIYDPYEPGFAVTNATLATIMQDWPVVVELAY